MDRLDHIGIARYIKLDARDLFRIGQQALHLLFCAAISQLEIIKHGIILLGKALICVLNGLHIRAHLVGIIRHIEDRLISQTSGLLGIAAE